MSYLARLKEKISQDAPKPEATKVSKAPFVPFVAPPPAPLRDISLPNELNDLIEKVGRAYNTPPDEYPLIRETAAKDIKAALQSYRIMAKNLDAGRIDDGMVEERIKCRDCANRVRKLTQSPHEWRPSIKHICAAESFHYEPMPDILQRCGKYQAKGLNDDK